MASKLALFLACASVAIVTVHGADLTCLPLEDEWDFKCEVPSEGVGDLSQEEVKVLGFTEPRRISTLIVPNIRFGRVPETLFEQLPNLRRLDMRNCSIKDFKGLENSRLAELDLSANQIQKIGENDLDSLASVSLLYLQNNEITEVHENAFSKFQHEQLTVDLTNNKIEQLDKKLFKHGVLPEKVANVYLVNNRVKDIEGVFNGLSKMKKLHLSGNKIQEIRDTTFSGCDSLLWLRMDDNEIHTIESKAFAQLPKLFFFTAKNNKLTTLDIFVPKELSTIYLNNNQIESISLRTEEQREKEVGLEVENNKVSSIYVQPEVKLEQIYATNNQISDVSNITEIETLIYLKLDKNPISDEDKEALKSKKSDLRELVL